MIDRKKLEPKSISQQFSDRKADALRISAELREVSTKLSTLADCLETGHGLPNKLHATATGEQVRRLISEYNTLKKNISYLTKMVKNENKL